MNSRIRFIAIIFIASFGILIARLFYWQIVKGAELSESARYQYESNSETVAPRGNILSDSGSPLAFRGDTWLVYAALPEIEEKPKDIAETLAPLFLEGEEYKDDDERKQKLLVEIDRIESLLKRDDVVWIPLKNSIETEVKRNIEALAIKGIGFERKEKRMYPESSSSAHLLGFVGKDDAGGDKGYFGLEGFYDLVLTGKPGFVSREADAAGIPIVLGDTHEISAANGVDLVTNIDKGIQLTIETELKDAIEQYGAQSGTVIVMEPSTGKIMGMASLPSFDPGEYWEYSDDLFRNPAISDLFEPGSVFKVLVMASGLDAEAVRPDTKCDICAGPLKVDKYSIETWNDEYHPDSTMTDVIKHSDNVGMAFVGQRLGAEKLYDYLDKFGIGHLTGVDLQGETTSELREKGTWNVVDLATTTFGQGIAVTPIQMIRAVGAIANDGVMVTPRVVGKIKNGGWETEVEGGVEKQVISKKAADEMTAMMVEAAASGEAKWTHMTGFGVAGKTGTAQIPIQGHYDAEKTIASFVGFAPSDDPKFVMLVTLKEPKTSQWASETAAPLWYSIARSLFFEFQIQPKN